MTPRERVVALLREGARAIRDPQESAHKPVLVLAPMATITHAGFRTLVEEFGGCDLYFTEMISAEALLGGTEFERYYRSLHPAPERTIYQVIGYTKAAIVGAAARLAGEPCAGIDINMGCSAPHLVRKGAGVAWMFHPEATARLVESLRAALPDRALSVKLRLGRDDNPESLIALARRIEGAGADFITLHPKRQKEGSGRVARWSYVDIVRKELSIPVVGNGGVDGWESYAARRGDAASPRSDGVMIARGAVRAPWLFAYLRQREDGAPALRVDLYHVLKRFIALIEEHQPRQFWPSRARRVYPYLFRNVPFGHSLGARLANERDYATGKAVALGYFRDHPEHRHFVERG